MERDLAALLQEQGRLPKAEFHFREALGGFRQVLGDDHPFTRFTSNNLAFVLNAESRFEEAEALLREGIPVRVETLGEKHWRTAEARSLFGEALAGLQRFREAERELLEGMSGLEASLPAGRRRTKLPPAILRVAKLYEAWDKPRQAAQWRARLPSAETP